MDPIKFNLQVNVTLGVSKELGDILSKLSNLPPLRLRPVEQPAQIEKPVAPAAPVAEPTTEAPAAVEAPQAEAPAKSVEPVQKAYTTEDVRAAMDRCRLRVEGEDYKNNAKSEGRVKWHSVLTERFKQFAGFVVNKDEEKPSQLPDCESRGRFIQMVDSVHLSDDGEKLIDDDLPF